MNTDINLLLKKDEESLKRKRRVKLLYFIAIILLSGSGIISFIIFMLIQTAGVSPIKKEQDEIISKISQFSSKQAKLSVAGDRISNIEEILKTRKDFYQVMNAILTKTPDKVFIEDFEINDTSIIMTARSVSLSSIGEFTNNLIDMVRKKEAINSLTLISLVFGTDENSYQISIRSEF